MPLFADGTGPDATHAVSAAVGVALAGVGAWLLSAYRARTETTDKRARTTADEWAAIHAADEKRVAALEAKIDSLLKEHMECSRRLSRLEGALRQQGVRLGPLLKDDDTAELEKK